jgi:hypothetical protein
MRLSSVLVLCVAFATASPALADTHTFIVANQPDGYGIDECLANGDHCGAYAALSYCERHQFTQASSFHKVSHDDVTGTIPVSNETCKGSGCQSYVAITCQR